MIKKKKKNYGVAYRMGWVWGIFQPNRSLRIEKSPTLGSSKKNAMKGLDWTIMIGPFCQTK